MKHLNESILSKKTGIYSKRFPTNPYPPKNDVIEFLERNGFKKIKFIGMYDFSRKYSYSKNPVYAIGTFNSPSNSWIRFGNGGNEPVFFWRLVPCSHGMTYDLYDLTGGPDGHKTFSTFEEFRETVLKYIDFR